MTDKKQNEQQREEAISFEQALERLEKIVAKMESGELPLAESMKHFEEGMKLANLCTEKLGETEKKIEVLMNKDKNDKPLEWTEFGEAESDADDA